MAKRRRCRKVKSGPRKGCCRKLKHAKKRKHSRKHRSVWTSPTYRGC